MSPDDDRESAAIPVSHLALILVICIALWSVIGIVAWCLTRMV